MDIHATEGKQVCKWRKINKGGASCNIKCRHKGYFADHAASHFSFQLRPIKCKYCTNHFRNRQERRRHEGSCAERSNSNYQVKPNSGFDTNLLVTNFAPKNQNHFNESSSRNENSFYDNQFTTSNSANYRSIMRNDPSQIKNNDDNFLQTADVNKYPVSDQNNAYVLLYNQNSTNSHEQQIKSHEQQNLYENSAIPTSRQQDGDKPNQLSDDSFCLNKNLSNESFFLNQKNSFCEKLGTVGTKVILNVLSNNVQKQQALDNAASRLAASAEEVEEG
ncbi:hypothetical protein HK099_007393 [Clydaea vesicula]|uniref:Uncharacterized protein n=1 Tax=Clydaea vesicula TaxID=447962 RepID=A0AAD5U9I0_9FUNG|nr:hypothetical protein HK099_007393 [Clydaea vesicula]